MGSVKSTPADKSQEKSPTHLPMENPGDDNDDAASKKSKTERSNKSLNEYLDTYTSEDNQSFQDFMDEADRKHRIKVNIIRTSEVSCYFSNIFYKSKSKFVLPLQYSWLFDAEQKHAENMKNALALPSIEQQALEYKRPLDIDTWSYRNKNYVMYVPEGKTIQ